MLIFTQCMSQFIKKAIQESIKNTILDNARLFCEKMVRIWIVKEHLKQDFSLILYCGVTKSTQQTKVFFQ